MRPHVFHIYPWEQFAEVVSHFFEPFARHHHAAGKLLVFLIHPIFQLRKRFGVFSDVPRNLRAISNVSNQTLNGPETKCTMGDLHGYDKTKFHSTFRSPEVTTVSLKVPCPKNPLVQCQWRFPVQRIHVSNKSKNPGIQCRSVCCQAVSEEIWKFHCLITPLSPLLDHWHSSVIGPFWRTWSCTQAKPKWAEAPNRLANQS